MKKVPPSDPFLSPASEVTPGFPWVHIPRLREVAFTMTYPFDPLTFNAPSRAYFPNIGHVEGLPVIGLKVYNNELLDGKDVSRTTDMASIFITLVNDAGEQFIKRRPLNAFNFIDNTVTNVWRQQYFGPWRVVTRKCFMEQFPPGATLAPVPITAAWIVKV